MLQTLKLLLPALIPSWRFFDEVRPSPRIEYALLETAQAAPQDWREFRPRPARLSVSDMLKRLLWNPGWNETLFLVSCAERLTTSPVEHSYQEILQRLARGIDADIAATPYLQFRLLFLGRNGAEVEKHVTLVSSVHHILTARAHGP